MLINDEELFDFPLNFVILTPHTYDPASSAGGSDFIEQEGSIFLIELESGTGVIELE
jgi:hypothetical protein